MKGLKVFLFLILFSSLMFLLHSSFVSASVGWLIEKNQTSAPVDNFLLNISWTNSTPIGSGSGEYQLNNISFNLTNTTGNLSLIYISDSNDTNITDLIFNSSGIANSSLVVWGNDTQTTTQTDAWFAFNISAPQAGVYEITVTEQYSNGADFITNTSTLILTIDKGATLITLFLDGIEDNQTYNASAPANFTAVLNVSGKEICIETNFTSDWKVCGETPLYNYTTIPSVTFEIYNITAYFPGDANYSSDSITYWINVTDRTPPTVSLSLSSSSIYRGDGITISCNASDNVGVTSSSLTVQKPTGITVPATCNSVFTDTLQTGTYIVTYTASDAAGNSDSKSTSFTVISPSAPSPAPSSLYVLHNWNIISPGTVVSASIMKAGLDVTEIELKVKNQANEVSIKVEKLAGQPAEVTHTVVGKVYQWIKITPSNLNDNNIDMAKIRFKVSKSWISYNNIDPASVALNRWETDHWNKLPTTKLSEDLSYIYYEAQAPGFSVFAITGETPSATTTTMPVTTTIPITTTTIPATIPTTTTTIPPESKPMDWLPIIVVILLVICVVGYLVWAKKYSKSKKK